MVLLFSRQDVCALSIAACLIFEGDREGTISWAALSYLKGRLMIQLLTWIQSVTETGLITELTVTSVDLNGDETSPTAALM